MISIKITGINEVYGKAKNFRENGREAINSALRAMLEYYRGVIVRKAPVRTGNLRRSFFTEFSDLKVSLFSNTKYGDFVHEGTRAHTIRIVRKKVLATRLSKAPNWRGAKSGGYAIFGKEVQHPGTKANPFVETAIKENEERGLDIFRKIMLRILDL